MLSDKESQRLMSGRFSLSLRRLAICSGGSADNSVLRGRGRIQQTAEGKLRFSYSGRVGFPTNRMTGETSGNVTMAAEMPLLQGVDSSGRQWRGNHVGVDHVSVNLFNLRNDAATGSIQELVLLTEPKSDAARLRMLVPGKHATPLTEWSFRDSAIECHFINHGNHLEVVVHSAEPLPGDFDLRIQEAIWFVLGGRALAILVELSTETAYETHVFAQTVGPAASIELLLPPRPSCRDAQAEIFVRYLRYAREAPTNEFHATSGHIRRIRSAGTIEQEVLALCIAIESFVQREHPRCGRPPADALDAIDALEAYVEVWTGNSTVKRRALGCVRRLRATNARNAIHELAGTGPLGEHHSQAWERTRHIAAHGGTPSRSRLEQTIRDRSLLYQALEFLILDRIGYAGPVTDRTRVGWPTVGFPPPRQ